MCECAVGVPLVNLPSILMNKRPFAKFPLFSVQLLLISSRIKKGESRAPQTERERERVSERERERGGSDGTLDRRMYSKG